MTIAPYKAPNAVLAKRYQILHSLGSGGMGTLYLARDLHFTSRFVAVKENSTQSSAAYTQFRLEAEVLATLHHPHLPAVTDHFTTSDGRQFLVMHYVEGENLEERAVRLGPLPEAQVLDWIDQVLDALTYLHAQSPPIIHRDVKPANIRITPEGKAVLVDFGVIKYAVPGQPTATIARAGSPGYAPIEQYAGGTDQRSDLYSAGATLYFALTGQAPPEAPLLAAGEGLPRPRELNSTISRRTEAAILRAMRFEARARFQSAADMRAALQGKRKQLSLGENVSQMDQRQKITVGGIAALVMVVVCALVGWMVWSMSDLRRTTPAPIATTPPPVTTIMPTEIPGTLLPTDTVPAGEPTSTARPTFTPVPTSTPAPTAAPNTTIPQPLPASSIELIAPIEGEEYVRSPITFEWSGDPLRAGQTYQVTVRRDGSDSPVQSELLTDQQWVHTPPSDKYGLWYWKVSVLQNGQVVAASEEWLFWFDPIGGPGDGNGDSTATPDTHG